MTFAADIVGAFEASNVEVVFGVPSEQLEAYYAALDESEIRHVLGRSEASAAAMADGYARASGRLGVVDGVGGPGAVNIGVGLIEAAGASSPVLALTGDNQRAFRGLEAIQDADNEAILAEHVKESWDPDTPDRGIQAIRTAIAEAVTGVPGPVHVNLTEDLLDKSPSSSGAATVPPTTSYPAARPVPDRESLEEAVEAIEAASRPVIIAGEGALRSQAWAAVGRLASDADIPVVTSMNGKGIVDEREPYALGVVGRWGFAAPANETVAESDLVLAVGTRLGELTTNRYSLLPEEETLVHVDLDPTWLGRTIEPDVAVLGDIRATVEHLHEGVADRYSGSRAEYIAELAEASDAWRESTRSELESDDTPVHPARLVAELEGALPPSSTVVSATSFPGFFSAAYYRVREPGIRYVQARGSDGINYALPQALGIQLAAPERPVVAVSGDGGFGYHVADLETAAREELPVTVVVLNNQSLRSSKASQLGNYNVDVSTDFHPDVDYAAVAEGFACEGHRIETPEALVEYLPAAIDADRPVLLDVQVDPFAMPPVKVG
ncbi:MAG: thiamine pyrophosphate-binding protein [Halodesulfurarchaeum sp.]